MYFELLSDTKIMTHIVICFMEIKIALPQPWFLALSEAAEWWHVPQSHQFDSRTLRKPGTENHSPRTEFLL